MKPERFTAGMFIFVIGALMLLVFFSIGSRAKELSDHPKIEWEKIYPFEGGMKASHEEKESFYEYVKNKLKNYTSEKLPIYHRMVESAKRYEDALGWNMVSVFDYNAVFRLKDGYLTNYVLSRDVTRNAEAVKNFSDFCTGMGAEFMYVNIPVKVCISEDKNISGVLDFANQNADRLLAMLKKYGVRYYDLRKNLHDAGMNHHEAFYVADQHWKAETGLWAAGEILKILRNDLSWDVKPEILSPKNFRYDIYRDCFMGAQGRKLTSARAKPEDFTLIYPKFDTQMKFEALSLKLNIEGDFSILYDMSEITYLSYKRGDLPLARIENKQARNNKRVLVLHGSFSNVVIPFMALELKNIDTIELHHFTGSVENFIKTVKPDAVLILYNSALPGRDAKPSATKREKKFFDFR